MPALRTVTTHAADLGRVDLAVDVGRDLAVMIRAERARQLDLHGLRRGQGIVQARTLTCQRLVPLVDLVRQENSLWLAVRSEGDRLGRGTLTAEAREDPRADRRRNPKESASVPAITSPMRISFLSIPGIWKPLNETSFPAKPATIKAKPDIHKAATSAATFLTKRSNF